MGFDIQHRQVTLDGDQRWVTVAVPLISLAKPWVIYCTDGQVVAQFSNRLQSELSAAELPSLIGIHSSATGRAEEYLPSDNPAFLAHEHFFVDHVRFWANETFGTTLEREQSCACGFSNGGAFALNVALRHPQRFAASIAFSVPPFGPLPSLAARRSQPAIYMAGGNVGPEKSIRKNMLKLTRELRHAGIPIQFHERDAGHTIDFWTQEIVAAVRWLNSLNTAEGQP